MAKDYAALAAKAAAEGKNMTVATAGGGGDFDPPKAGPGMGRLVGYIEIGKQKGSYQGKPTIKEKVMLIFELIGKNHPPVELEDGTKLPHRVTIEENLSLNEKARLYKLFQRMNYAGKTEHMVGLLGDPFKLKVIHRKYKGRDGKERIAVELYDKELGMFTIEPPRRELVDEDGESTGEYAAIAVGPALTPLKAFLWDHSDMDDWNNLFIDGAYPERKDKDGVVTSKAKSKNVFQNTIKQATNFSASPIYALIAAAGGNLDIPEAELPDEAEEGDDVPPAKVAPTPVVVPEGAEADDALNGVV